MPHQPLRCNDGAQACKGGTRMELTWVGNDQAQNVKPKGTGGGSAAASQKDGSFAAEGQESNFFGKVVSGRQQDLNLLGGAERPNDACEPGEGRYSVGVSGGCGVASGFGAGRMPDSAPVGPWAQAMLSIGGNQVRQDLHVDRDIYGCMMGPGMLTRLRRLACHA